VGVRVCSLVCPPGQAQSDDCHQGRAREEGFTTEFSARLSQAIGNQVDKALTPRGQQVLRENGGALPAHKQDLSP
jgi:hypothetical protein